MKDLLWTGTGETEVAAIPISLGGNSVFGPGARTGLLLTDGSTPWLNTQQLAAEYVDACQADSIESWI